MQAGILIIFPQALLKYFQGVIVALQFFIERPQIEVIVGIVRFMGQGLLDHLDGSVHFSHIVVEQSAVDNRVAVKLGVRAYLDQVFQGFPVALQSIQCNACQIMQIGIGRRRLQHAFQRPQGFLVLLGFHIHFKYVGDDGTVTSNATPQVFQQSQGERGLVDLPVVFRQPQCGPVIVRIEFEHGLVYLCNFTGFVLGLVNLEQLVAGLLQGGFQFQRFQQGGFGGFQFPFGRQHLSEKVECRI